MVDCKADLIEILHSRDTEQVADRDGDVVLHQQHLNAVFHPGGIPNQPSSMPEQFFELAGFKAAHVYGGDEICSEQLSQHVRVHLVVLDLGRSNSLGLHRIGDHNLKTFSSKKIQAELRED